MQTYSLKTPTPPILSIIDWVAEEPQNAAKVGASLIVVGVAILVLVVIFGS
jgi:hypothetical protein